MLRIPWCCATRHLGEHLLAIRSGQSSAATEDVDERGPAIARRLHGAHEEMRRHTDSHQVDPDPPADLDGDDRERDRDAETTPNHHVQHGVQRIVVVLVVPAERTRAHEQETDECIERRCGTVGCQGVESRETFDDVEAWIVGGGDDECSLVEFGALGDDPTEMFHCAIGAVGTTWVPVARLHVPTVPSDTFSFMYPGAIAAQHPDKPAVIMATSGFVQTFAELDRAANRLSHLFRSVGLQPGDHVAICMENHPRYLEVLWGCHYAGLIYTAASSRLTSGELSYILNDCGARVFITSKYKSDQALEIVADTPGVELRLMLDGVVAGHESYEEAVAQHPDTPLDELIAGTDMLYSSGTTGQPKGVLPAFVPTPLAETPGSVTGMLQLLFAIDEKDTYLSPAPLYHAAPLRFSMSAQRLGATVVVMEHFDAEDYLRCIEEFTVTASQVVPTMFVRMLKLPAEVRGAYDVSTLRCVLHAAAPCPIPVKRQMIEWFGPIIHEYYAGTEGNGFVYCNSEMWLGHEGTVGMPIGCVIHIVGDDGEELPAYEPGTIYFEGGASFEYHNDPEKTKGSRHPNGWTTLGDVGYVDADGFLYLTDRKAYMIISGGVNIYPQESENLLITHPKVVDVAVFGVPNDDFGEEVKAVVQPVEMPVDAETAATLERELIAFCRSELADVKCPRSIDFRPELPRHPTGKLYKRLLKDEYWKDAGRSI
jgi:long-chain acyl-CoA synthetase